MYNSTTSKNDMMSRTRESELPGNMRNLNTAQVNQMQTQMQMHQMTQAKMAKHLEDLNKRVDYICENNKDLDCSMMRDNSTSY